ncbi:MAG: hypothetical protein AB2L20_14900 [Mangrovibacterium sp.]
MQKDVQLSENAFIQDLWTGFSYVNFDRRIEDVTDPETGEVTGTVPVAGSQYRVKNPANYDRIVDSVVKENYPDGADQAALRKGIVDAENVEFVAFNNFVESIKQKCKDEGIQ